MVQTNPNTTAPAPIATAITATTPAAFNANTPGPNIRSFARTADPRRDPAAVKLDHLTYTEALVEGLEVMDAAALSMCRDNDVRMVVFGLEGPGNVTRALEGERIGTLITAR